MLLVLSLKKDWQRRLRLEQLLKTSKSAYRYVWAVERLDIDNELSHLHVKRINPHLSWQEVSCSLGHLKLYRNLDDTCDALVEDDAVPFLNFDPRKLESLKRNLPKNSVLILGVSSKRDFLAGELAPEISGNAFRLDLFSIYFLRGTVAYMLSKDTALAIEKSQVQYLTFADDWWYFFRRRVIRKFYFLEMFTHPPVDALSSNIEAYRTKNRPKVVMRFRVLVRFIVIYVISLLRWIRGQRRC